MAKDLKYGEVVLENGNIGEDEPVVVFRANDKLLPALLSRYWSMCAANGSPDRHLQLIIETQTRVVKWQEENGSKIPDSEASRAWMDH